MQKRVAEFVGQYGLDAAVPYRMLDLASEVGELAKELLKAMDYGEREFAAAALGDAWADELGDVLFSLICVANVTEVDLERALATVLAKYQARLESGREAGSGR